MCVRACVRVGGWVGGGGVGFLYEWWEDVAPMVRNEEMITQNFMQMLNADV